MVLFNYEIIFCNCSIIARNSTENSTFNTEIHECQTIPSLYKMLDKLIKTTIIMDWTSIYFQWVLAIAEWISISKEITKYKLHIGVTYIDALVIVSQKDFASAQLGKLANELIPLLYKTSLLLHTHAQQMQLNSQTFRRPKQFQQNYISKITHYN